MFCVMNISEISEAKWQLVSKKGLRKGLVNLVYHLGLILLRSILNYKILYGVTMRM